MSTEVIQQLVSLSEGALALADQTARERDSALSKIAQLENRVSLVKVASEDQVGTTLQSMEGAGLVPVANREKIAGLLATHEGALEVVNALVFQSFSPPGGEPVRPLEKAASVGSSGESDGELAMLVKLAREGFN